MRTQKFEVKQINLKSAEFLSAVIKNTPLTLSKAQGMKICLNCDFIYLGWKSCPRCASDHFHYIIYWDPEAWMMSCSDSVFDRITCL